MKTPRTRLAFRLAWRGLLTARLRSALIAMMVAIPVALATLAGLLVASTQPTPLERVTVQLGQMQARVVTQAGQGSRLVQNPLDENDFTGIQTNKATQPLQVLLPDTAIVSIGRAAVTIRTPSGIGAYQSVSGAAWDTRFRGRYDRVSGRTPSSPHEVMANAAALNRLGVHVGSWIELVRPSERRVQVVGVLDDRTIANTDSELFGTAGALGVSASEITAQQYYLPDTALSWRAVQRLNDSGYTALSRTVVLDPPAVHNADLSQAAAATNAQAAAIAAVVAAFLAFVVVLLSGAAHAVSIRQQQRTLATLAIIGAPPRLLAASARASSIILAIAGTFAGIVVGLIAGSIVMVATTDGSSTLYYGWHFPTLAVVLASGIAVCAAVLAARRAARIAASTNPLEGLTEADTTRSTTGGRTAGGITLIVIGVLIAVIGAVGVGAGALRADGSLSFLFALPTVPLVVGPVLLLLGFITAIPAILTALDRLARPLPIPIRLGVRDLARNAERTSPAISAIAATAFVAVLTSCVINGYAAAQAEHYDWAANLGQIVAPLHYEPSSASNPRTEFVDPRQATTIAQKMFPGAQVATISAVPDASGDFNAAQRKDTRTLFAKLPYRVDCDECRSMSDYLTSTSSDWAHIYVGDPSALKAVVGAPPSRDAIATLTTGGAVAFTPAYIRSRTTTIQWWTADQLAHNDQFKPGADPARTSRLSAVLERPQHTLPYGILISPATAARLGLDVRPFSLIFTPQSAATPHQIDALSQALGAAENTPAGADVFQETGPQNFGATASLLALLVAAALVASATATVIALTRVQSRATNRTLHAIGLNQKTLRTLLSVQAALTTFIGIAIGAGVALAAAGIVGQARGPIPFEPGYQNLSLLVIGVPLVVGLVAWLAKPLATSAQDL